MEAKSKLGGRFPRRIPVTIPESFSIVAYFKDVVK
jgi:hypothetical protein